MGATALLWPTCLSTPIYPHTQDYQLEAYNTMTFKQQMAGLKGIVVPTIHPEFTSRKVIISDWIYAEKFSDASPAEVW